jgi:hypothetical protein
VNPADPHANAYDKAQAMATLVAKWAGLAAAGVAGARYVKAEVPDLFARKPAATPPVTGPAAPDTPGTVAPRSGETTSTRVGKDVHRGSADARRAEGQFDLVNEPIRDKSGNPIQVPKRVDLKTGEPQPGSPLQEAIPDAVSFKKGGLILDDKPLGRPLAKDRQEIIRAIKAYEAREGVLPNRIAIPRYDPFTGAWVRTELHRPEDLLPRPRKP